MTQMANNANGGAITRPLGAPSRLQGEEEEDIVLPRIHIFQGLPQEREIYGENGPDDKPWKAGDFINTLTKERVDARKFTPIFGYTEYIRFKEPRGSGLEYRTRDKSQVPAEDLEWDRVNGRPPAATKFINWVVLAEGDPTPIVLSFKTTSINTGRAINGMEKIRGTRGPGLYEVVLRKRSNAKGAWLSPEVRPVGDPPADVKDLAEALFNSLASAAVQVDVQGAESDFDPENE